MTATTTSARPSTHLWRGLVLVCLAGTVWGTIGPAVHVVHEGSGLSPLTIGAYRAIAAVGVLLAAAVTAGRLRRCLPLVRPHWRRVTIVGLLTAAFQLLFFVAVIAIGVSVGTVICLGFAPVLLLIVASAGRRRLPSLGQAVTVTTAVFGLLLVSLAGGSGIEAANPVLGVLAALGSGAAYALSAHVGAPLSQRLDTLTMTTSTMCVTAAILVPGGLTLASLRGEVITTTDVESWLLLAYLGVVTMAIAYALLFAGLRNTPSGTAVVATLLEPVTAVLIAVAFLGERLTVAGVVGSVLIVAAIGSLGRRAEETQPQ